MPPAAHYLVELYTPNPAWQTLPAEQRQAFLAAIGQAMGSLSALGVEVLTLTELEPGIDQGSKHRFLGIWRLASPEARTALLDGIRASGWYRYFDHVNAAGTAQGFEQHLAALINA